MRRERSVVLKNIFGVTASFENLVKEWTLSPENTLTHIRVDFCVHFQHLPLPPNPHSNS